MEKNYILLGAPDLTFHVYGSLLNTTVCVHSRHTLGKFDVYNNIISPPQSRIMNFIYILNEQYSKAKTATTVVAWLHSQTEHIHVHTQLQPTF